MASEFHHLRRVEFSETDMAGIVHFANYLRYMEEAEHAFLRSLGLGVHPPPDADGSHIGFPRLSSRCEYSRPLRFEDEVDIWLRVARKGRSSLTYQFLLSRSDEAVAKGELVVVCCRWTPGRPMERTPLLAPYDERIEVSPHEPLTFREAAPAPPGKES